MLALDDSIVDGDQVDYLIKFCPTKEEMELLKVYIYSADCSLKYHWTLEILTASVPVEFFLYSAN